MSRNEIKPIGDLINREFEKRTEPERGYLGCSLAGNKCDRFVWLKFRWVLKEGFSGRVKRMFRRGHNEEKFVIDDLRAIGVGVLQSQRELQIAPHIKGHVDGIIESGLVEGKIKHQKFVLEIKTHSLKSFNELKKNKVMKSHYQHFVQMQLYMHGEKAEAALYYAVCKDNDEIYTEVIEYNPVLVEKVIDRLRAVIKEPGLPEGISRNPAWFECKMCSVYRFCHKKKMLENINCRTCAHSTPMDDGSWKCEKYPERPIPESFQRKGCEHHVIHPDLVPWENVASESKFVAVYKDGNGRLLRNGKSDPDTFESTEILANEDACFDNPPELRRVRKILGGKVTETC